ncbi:MAG: DUF502 domain-containing protein [Verrucomicrobiales bacterium]|nr:DUF502 domain-containing protein [Verrucomicrobiales bacterium]
MSDSTPPKRRHYLITGLLAIIPLWITWLVLAFLYKTLSGIGEPIVKWVSSLIQVRYPQLDKFLTNPIFIGVIECLVVVLFIYGVGVFTTIVVGKRIFNFFENLLERVPVVKHIYGAVRKLTIVLQEKPGNDVERVVLIDFPSPEMKTVGLVTRVMDDARTGRKLAAVYVPTTPNPTSGYLEIVPVDRLTPTDWTMDQAMTFIVSGGAIAPENLVYDNPSVFVGSDDPEEPLGDPVPKGEV